MNEDAYYKILQKWRAKNITSSAELECILDGYIISFAYNSGKIENENITYNDTREIFKNDKVTSYTGNLRTLFEIRNAKDASEYILNAFEKRCAIDISFIKNIHYELTKNTYDKRRYDLGERPGEFKKNDYVTGKNEVGALQEDVHIELNELIEEINLKFEDKNILTAAAYFHLKFENIHPFADGNGRIGRLLTNYLLLVNDHPPLVFQEKNKKIYYDCLEKWDNNQNIKPMKEYMMQEIINTWEKRFLT